MTWVLEIKEFYASKLNHWMNAENWVSVDVEPWGQAHCVYPYVKMKNYYYRLGWSPNFSKISNKRERTFQKFIIKERKLSIKLGPTLMAYNSIVF